ncbi:MAG: TIR-like domain-containing protein [Planctomycetota bacterium]|nr:MAG: TIR-like domain-containing protein [Planctomycetota bacterium]
MARRVFFSFHYEADAMRASVVRNSWVTKPNRKEAGYIDAASWEKIKKRGKQAIERWINTQLKDTSVTVVLIGKNTYLRQWVKYEIKKSYAKGNGMLGIYIHNIKDVLLRRTTKGKNPFSFLQITKNGRKRNLSEIYKTYDWVNDDGYTNLGKWVEEAARKAGK